MCARVCTCIILCQRENASQRNGGCIPQESHDNRKHPDERRKKLLSGRARVCEKSAESIYHAKSIEITWNARIPDVAAAHPLAPVNSTFRERGYNERHAESVSNSGQRFLSATPNRRSLGTSAWTKLDSFLLQASLNCLITKDRAGRISFMVLFFFLSFCYGFSF